MYFVLSIPGRNVARVFSTQILYILISDYQDNDDYDYDDEADEDDDNSILYLHTS